MRKKRGLEGRHGLRERVGVRRTGEVVRIEVNGKGRVKAVKEVTDDEGSPYSLRTKPTNILRIFMCSMCSCRWCDSLKNKIKAGKERLHSD